MAERNHYMQESTRAKHPRELDNRIRRSSHMLQDSVTFDGADGLGREWQALDVGDQIHSGKISQVQVQESGRNCSPGPTHE
jgi:hypothetical protein